MKSPREDVRAIIIAEGGSARLRPLTDHLPSSLVPVGGTPILDTQIQTLLQLGVQDITVIGGYRAAQVEQACRAYPTVQFRTNPDYSREEPRVSALFAAGLAPGSRAVLVMRGDLILAPDLIEDAAGRTGNDAFITSGTSKPIGLYRLGAESMRTFLEAGRESANRDLFSLLDGHVGRNGAESVAAGDRPWARVVTMEDLARALKAHREAAMAQVEGSEKRLQNSSPNAVSFPTLVEGTRRQASRVVAGDGSEVLETEGGMTFLPRPLLRVLHR